MSLLATSRRACVCVWGGGEVTATQTKNQTKVNLTLAPKKHLQLIKIECRPLTSLCRNSKRTTMGKLLY